MDQQSKGGAPRSRLSRYWWVVGLAIAALIVVVLAPLASADPDGLERVAGDHGFLQSARDAIYSIVPDYTLPGVDGNLSTILAGLIGIVIVFGLMVLVGRLLARRRTQD
jgi:type IV secretory pathway VirB2 component (pilin)